MAEFVKAIDMPLYRDLLDELFNVEAGLTNWEIDFLESLNDWEGSFTVSQSETLNKIYERIF